MRNAQKAALMAIFAALEDRSEAEDVLVELDQRQKPEANEDKLIRVDLAQLAKTRGKIPA